MGGIVSQLFLPFALTVTFALAASLVVALTVVPVLAYLFIDKVKLNVDEDGEPKNSFWIRVYTPTIKFVLRNRLTRWAMLGSRSGPVPASLALVGNLPTQFINTGSEKILGVTLAPPAGATSDAVLAEATEAEASCWRSPDVEVVQTSVPGDGDTGFRTILAALKGQPANSATHDRPPRAQRRPRREAEASFPRARSDQGRRLQTSASPRLLASPTTT